ncbi:hypothetical protein SAMN05428949_1197 [Chitinophaga sp. YR627]|nr:hypothetical protein SAMN05428949_1197 [Chitinophaga sp. YR627]
MSKYLLKIEKKNLDWPLLDPCNCYQSKIKEIMKYIQIPVLSLILVFFTSCGGQNKANLSKENSKSETTNVVTSPSSYEQYVYTKYTYADAIGKRLIIQNSFPRGGLKYTDPKGNVYIYAIFWTRIINETPRPFELAIDFPVDSFELPSSAGSYYRIFLPADTMTHEKEDLFNYGLPVAASLDNALQKAPSLKRTIYPGDSGTFYVVALTHRAVNGTLRTGLSLKGQDLFYRINDKEIYCGKINAEKLILQKETKSDI